MNIYSAPARKGVTNPSEPAMMRLSEHPIVDLEGDDMRHLPLALMLVAPVAGASFGHRDAPLPQVRAAPAPARWSVDERSGCRVRNPFGRDEVQVRWSGECDAQGRASGSGVLEWRLGGKTSRFRGEVREGAPNGRGVQTWPGGDRYEGHFRNGKRDGRGTYVWSNGDRYRGEWRNGRQHGMGVFTWRGGNRYAGSFRRGQADGFGVCQTEGSLIQGEWDNGCIRKGLLVFAVGKQASQCR